MSTPRYLRASVSPWVVIVIVIAISMMTATIAAQVRPAPQPPPRRTAPPPRTAPAPKRGEPEPDERKPAPEEKKPAPSAPQVASSGDAKVDAGAALYKKNGCYECHVNDAQGGPQGPRLGPNPLPFARFQAYVRNPSGDMPPFTAKVISDDDLASIYAFIQSRPMPPPVKDIPLLAP